MYLCIYMYILHGLSSLLFFQGVSTCTEMICKRRRIPYTHTHTHTHSELFASMPSRAYISGLS